MKALEQIEDIFYKLKDSSITEEEAKDKIKENIFKMNQNEARMIMKKLDIYQYETKLKKTVYEICPIVYELMKECE